MDYQLTQVYNNIVVLMEYVAAPFLFALDALLGFLVPLYCTFRSSPTNERWLVHWLTFLLVSLTVLPFLRWVLSSSCTTYWLLKVVLEFVILFVVGNYVPQLLIFSQLRSAITRLSWCKSASTSPRTTTAS